MRGPALDLNARILARIGSTSGRVWTPVDFVDLAPRASVDKALERLVHVGELRRVDRGLYDRPRVNSLTGKETVPGPWAIIEAVARRDQIRVLIDGLTAANDLGLTTVVPARVVVLTDARHRTMKIDNLDIRFRTVAPTRLYWAGRPAMRVVQAMRWLQDLLRGDRDRIVARVAALLADPIHGPGIREDLREGLHTLPTWMQTVERDILAASALADHETRDVDQLQPAGLLATEELGHDRESTSHTTRRKGKA